MSGLGHNKGPTMEPGARWRRVAWKKSREALLPTLPIEVVRRRVKRARELGLDYKSYAGFHAANGRDIVAFLFSSNALRPEPQTLVIEAARADKLSILRQCGRIALVHPPATPERIQLANADVIDVAGKAPTLLDTWPEARAKIEAMTANRGLPRDGVLVIGDTALEREWMLAGRLGGYLTADRYFGERP